MTELTYSVVRFDGTTLPGATKFCETEIDADGKELASLTLNEAIGELQPVAERYLEQCRKQLVTFNNGVGYPKESHFIDYSVRCCFGIVRNDGWLCDPEDGSPLKKLSTWSELSGDDNE